MLWKPQDFFSKIFDRVSDSPTNRIEKHIELAGRREFLIAPCGA
jgi:hypothetical protein